MKKFNQPVDSVNTSGLAFNVDTSITVVVTKQEEVPVVAVPEVEVKEESVVVEQVIKEKVEPKKTSKKKEVEDNDVVPMSTINKATESND